MFMNDRLRIFQRSLVRGGAFATDISPRWGWFMAIEKFG